VTSEDARGGSPIRTNLRKKKTNSGSSGMIEEMKINTYQNQKEPEA
jgi:hypothetical protein